MENPTGIALDATCLPPFNTATFANDGNAGENIMMNDTELSGGIALLDEEALDLLTPLVNPFGFEIEFDDDALPSAAKRKAKEEEEDEEDEDEDEEEDEE